jgi:dephospho-CoA kinase
MTAPPAKNSPHIIGLTGSIAMGKSTVAEMFVAEGVPAFNADHAVHQLQGPNGALVGAIAAAFPGTTGTGGVDRQKLGAQVLGNAEKLRQLEAIVHPAVAAMRKEFLAAHQNAPLILFDIPLLFEKGGAAGVDTVVVVSAPADQQRARALARPGMTAEKFEHILSLQMPDAEKRGLADYVIDTGTSLEETRTQVRTIIKKLRSALARDPKEADI